MKKTSPKGMLGRRHGLAKNNPSQSQMVNASLIGGGIILGMISYSKRETPLGAVLLPMGAAAAAIGLVLLIHQSLLPDA